MSLHLLTAVDKLVDLANCEIVIEAVIENTAVKRQVFNDLEAIVSTDCVLATNTSTLSVEGISQGLSLPERVIGMHFFMPAHTSQLVEIASPELTNSVSKDRAIKYCSELGKSPLLCKDTPGFVVNRFYLPLINEAARCLDDGLGTVDQIEASAQVAFGLRVGPFGVCNMGRPETTQAAIQGLSKLGSFYEIADSIVRHGEAGTAWPISNDGTENFSESLVSRLRGAVFYAVLDALEGGVANPLAFDVGASKALYFELPPVTQMRSLGQEKVKFLVEKNCTGHGVAMPNIPGSVFVESSEKHEGLPDGIA
jgi:3-hydroxybutyryl-CoA dehydrogenase